MHCCAQTQAEAWLSMQDASTAGLATASAEKSRYTIVPLHNANATLSKMLTELWAGKSAQEAHDILAAPDVQVTNESDKKTQLPKILKLNETIKQTLEAHNARDAALQRVGRAISEKDASALTAALSAAEKAGVAPSSLETGRKMQTSFQAAGSERQQVLDAFTEAQRVAKEAFERAQQLAKDKGVNVELKSNDSSKHILDVTVSTNVDGRSDSVTLTGDSGSRMCVVQ